MEFSLLPAQRESEVTRLVPVKHLEKSLLEKLRLKYSQKPWNETIKLTRLCLDKPVGNALKCSLYHPVLRCKNMLQEALKAKSLSVILSRIECISKQKGLDSHLGPNEKICYITSEMFYIEVQVKKNGNVSSVKLAHHGETPVVCNELLQFLRAKDFKAFGRSLEGLLLLYNIPGNSEIKAKVYIALRSLEADLSAMFNLYSSKKPNDKEFAILHGQVGYLSPRCGGSLVGGYKAYLSIMGSNNWFLLPNSPLFSGLQQDSNMPSFSVLTEECSMDLPACFCFMFTDPLPLLLPFVQKIQCITGLPVAGIKQAPFHELITHLENSCCTTDEASTDAQFILSIPDCRDHCYAITSVTDNKEALMGILVDKIPFTHPSQVPPTLEVLRHQAAYSTLINSCISSTRKTKECTDMTHFEISLQKNCRIGISFQNPSGVGLSCVAVDVLSSRQLKCILYKDAVDPSFPCNNEFIVKVLQCCMSIPITMRAILKKSQNTRAVSKMETYSATVHPLTTQGIERDVSMALHHDKQQVNSPDKKVLGHNKHKAVNGNLGHEMAAQSAEHNSDFTIETYRFAAQFNCNIVEEQSTSFAKESSPIMAEGPVPLMAEVPCQVMLGGPSSVILEVSSPVLSEEPSSSMTEHSSSFTGDLSTSITEEFNLNVSGFMVSEKKN
uniref:Mediator of RNA polymerase II transcription subunit 1 n=1 Tax=Xenopus tropicalis TaxID=8364 RepID=A0A803JHM7_XENTR